LNPNEPSRAEALFDFDQIHHHRFRREETGRSSFIEGLRWIWGHLAGALPRGVTPNAITLVGQLSFTVVALIALAMWWSSPSRTLGPGISIALAVTYFGCWFSDGIDGIHARRTKQFSRVGELYDHGLDPLTYNLAGLIFLIALQGELTAASAVLFVGFQLLANATIVRQWLTGAILFSPSGDVFRMLWCSTMLAHAAWGASLWDQTLHVEPLGAVRLGAALVVATAALVVLESLRNWASIVREPRGRVAAVFYALAAAGGLVPLLWQDEPWWVVGSLPAMVAIGFVFNTTQAVIIAGSMTKAPAIFRRRALWLAPASLPLAIALPVPAVLAASVVFTVVFATLAAWIAATEHHGPRARPRVTYVAGVFDFCHEGHVRLLDRVRGLGGQVVVGVCTDRYTRSYKCQPHFTEAERCAAIRATGLADVVVLVDGEHGELYRTHGVTHLVHGDDWDREKYIDHMDRAAIESLGIEVVLLAHTPGISSTALRAEVRKSA